VRTQIDWIRKDQNLNKKMCFFNLMREVFYATISFDNYFYFLLYCEQCNLL
jgi:hypothetical protein